MAKIGTLAWMAKTHGNLTVRDRMDLIYQGMRARAATKKRMKAGRKARYYEVEDILPPDSAIAVEAMAIAEEASDPYLFNHCMRSYFWARLTDDGGKKFDDEAMFTAIMFHDLGLVKGYRLNEDAKQCFTWVGAQEARQLAQKHNWSDRRADLVANAITLHLNIVVGDEHGREAQLVRNGAGADVAGIGIDILHKDQVASVIEQYPRLQMKENIIKDLNIEVKAHPCCRIAFMHQRLDFPRLIRRAPFAE